MSNRFTQYILIAMALGVVMGNSRDGRTADFMVAALHACSTESRFVHRGLLRNFTKAPLHWAVTIDPAIAVAPKPAGDASAENDGIVFGDTSTAAAR
ncbi:MAG: hypothetical protein JSS22_21200 [Proteobacteria bacterium]|nr:hypothetical protein [Pseudomonadota bacterium]